MGTLVVSIETRNESYRRALPIVGHRSLCPDTDQESIKFAQTLYTFFWHLPIVDGYKNKVLFSLLCHSIRVLHL